MPERKPLTPQEFAIVADHIDPLIESLEKSLASHARLPIKSRNEGTKGQMLYWRCAISALKWARGLALQRTKGVEDGERSTV